MSNEVNRQVTDATLNNAELRFRNFTGTAGQYNAEGQRNFCVLLDPGVAQAMMDDGWNIKFLKPRDPEDVPQAYIKVKINFNGPRPPKIWMINSKGRLMVPEEMASVLDWADFQKVDLIISPYRWDIQGKQGVTAYLKTLFATLREDELELRYSEVPEVGAGGEESAQKALPWGDLVDEEDIIEAELVEEGL